MRYFVTGPVEGGTQWYDVRDSEHDGPLGMNTAVASFSVDVPQAEWRALTVRDGLNLHDKREKERIAAAKRLNEVDRGR